MGQSFLGKARQYFCTSTSRSSFPRSESCRIAVAVMGLEIEPSRNRVADVAGTKFSRSAIPKPRDQASAPFSTTATEIPGTPPMVMKLDTARSTCARLSAGKPLLWARGGRRAKEKAEQHECDRAGGRAYFRRTGDGNRFHGKHLAGEFIPELASTGTNTACRVASGRVLSRSTPPCRKALTWTVTAP